MFDNMRMEYMYFLGLIRCLDFKISNEASYNLSHIDKPMNNKDLYGDKEFEYVYIKIKNATEEILTSNIDINVVSKILEKHFCNKNCDTINFR